MNRGEALEYAEALQHDYQTRPEGTSESQFLMSAEAEPDYPEAKSVLLDAVADAALSDVRALNHLERRLLLSTNAEGLNTKKVPFEQAPEPEIDQRTDKQKKLAEWTEAVWKKFSAPLQHRSPGKNQTRELRSRNRALDKALKNFEHDDGSRRHLYFDPEAYVYVTKTFCDSYPATDRTKEFAKVFRESASELLDKQGWKKIDSPWLQTVIKMIADEEGEHTLEAVLMLKNYFDSVSNVDDGLETMHRYGLAVLDMIGEDTETLKTATRILGMDTKVLTTDSPQYAGLALGLIAWEENPEKFAKAWKIDYVTDRLWFLMFREKRTMKHPFEDGDNFDPIMKYGGVELYEVLQQLDPTYKKTGRIFSPAGVLGALGTLYENILSQFKGSISIDDEENIKAAFNSKLIPGLNLQITERLKTCIGRGLDIEAELDKLPSWFVDSIYKSPDELGRKYDAYIGDSHQHLRMLGPNLLLSEDLGYTSRTQMRIPVGSDIMLGVFLPTDNMPDDNELEVAIEAAIMQEVIDHFQDYGDEILHDYHFWEVDKAGYSHLLPSAYFTVKIPDLIKDEEGTPINTIHVRVMKRVELDNHTIHPLQEFNYTGFPDILGLSGLNDSERDEIEEAIWDDLLHNGTRFVPRRGLVIPVTDEQLQEIGLRSVKFKALPDNMIEVVYEREDKDIRMVITDQFVPTEKYKIKDSLTTTPDSAAYNAVMYTMATLREWMCAENVEVETNRGGKPARTTLQAGKHNQVVNVGHFAYIPIKANGEPSKRSDDQWYACVEERNEDLDERNEARKQESRAVDPKTGKIRNSTYYKEIDSPGAKPLVAHIKL